jgi:predicted small lipoprotein YifL
MVGGSLALLMTLVLAACGTDGPLQPDGDDAAAVDASLAAAAHGVNTVASASGGVKYTLLGLDFDGDGVDDPIHQRLTFTAMKGSDGTVKGKILYVQEAFGESFRFKGDVSCINVYDGNRVKFGGPVTQSDDATVPVGTFMWFHSIDNGQGAGASPDQTTGFGLGDNAANEAFCNSAALPNPRFLSEVTAGNLTVSG